MFLKKYHKNLIQEELGRHTLHKLARAREVSRILQPSGREKSHQPLFGFRGKALKKSKHLLHDGINMGKELFISKGIAKKEANVGPLN
jgi:hypothetical protein